MIPAHSPNSIYDHFILYIFYRQRMVILISDLVYVDSKTMEIISYFSPCPAAVNTKKHGQQGELPIFSSITTAVPVDEPLAPVFATRRKIAFHTMQKNIKMIAKPILFLYGIFLLFYGGVLLFAHFTRPAPVLDLAYLPSAELETLNTAMSDFVISMVEQAQTEAIPAEMLETLRPVYTEPVSYSQYRVKTGDTISEISHRFGLKNISTLISVNEIDNTRLLRSGQTLKIPSMDGVLHIADSGDSLEGISARYGVTVEDILDVNDLTEAALNVGQKLFIPGAVMDKQALRKALGELFAKPLSCSYRITSYFGPRADPFTGVASSHTGIDMAVPQGTPIKAAMGGKIAAVGFTNVYGYYVIINHENGYQTLYAHMLRKSPVNVGQRVSQGEQIGLVGSTGYSTGPHLHFTVYKNGKLIDPLSVLK